MLVLSWYRIPLFYVSSSTESWLYDSETQAYPRITVLILGVVLVSTVRHPDGQTRYLIPLWVYFALTPFFMTFLNTGYMYLMDRMNKMNLVSHQEWHRVPHSLQERHHIPSSLISAPWQWTAPQPSCIPSQFHGLTPLKSSGVPTRKWTPQGWPSTRRMWESVDKVPSTSYPCFPTHFTKNVSMSFCERLSSALLLPMWNGKMISVTWVQT